MKSRPCLRTAFALAAIIFLVFINETVLGYDLTDKLSIGGVMAGTYQQQWVDGDDNPGRGALSFQPEFSFRPTAQDEFYASSDLQYMKDKYDSGRDDVKGFIGGLRMTAEF